MGTRSRVAVAMSGGVDSSTAAYLLTEQGHEVVGLFMQTGVPWASPEDARAVATYLGIPFHVVDCSAEFGQLIDDFCAEYSRGRTPNPCIQCNAALKFGRLLRHSEAVQAQYVATGHYARVERRSGRWALRRGLDSEKDQSYFLFAVNQEHLARTLFPLGELTKEEVRAVAEEAGLPVHSRPESQDACFIPEGGHRALLAERLGVPQPGRIVDVDGKVLGEHPGCREFTIGQRRGLGIAMGEPYYVVAIEPETNTVVIGPESALYSRACYVQNVVWNALSGLRLPRTATVQIRYQHQAAQASICPTGIDEVGVLFEEPQRAITPGQAAIFYEDDVVLGGGWIHRVARLPADSGRPKGCGARDFD